MSVAVINVYQVNFNHACDICCKHFTAYNIILNSRKGYSISFSTPVHVRQQKMVTAYYHMHDSRVSGHDHELLHLGRAEFELAK